MKEELNPKALGTVRRMIQLMGENPHREGLLDTPKRVVKSWKELFGGYVQNPKSILSTTFRKHGYDEMVLLKDIQMFSTCEHHLLPFFGKVHIAYIPGDRVVGLSKLARLVECFSRRLQIQERLTEEIATAIENILQPRGVGVVIDATHFCMVARGANKQGAHMMTSSLRGAFKQEKTRQEFMSLIKGQ